MCNTGVTEGLQTGHRIKDENEPNQITWVHSILKYRRQLPKNWELTQCLFGEHLLGKYPDKPVCLVEAEKTALICAALMPKCIWVAVGGKGQLGDKVEVLYGRTILAFPDSDAREKWIEKIKERPYLNIQISNILEKYATPEELNNSADIADVLIRWILERKSMVASKAPEPPPAELYADNPVMQEVMHYISPEYCPEVDALIRELDLEPVSVTKISE